MTRTELAAHYAEVRRRLDGGRPPPAPKPEPKPEPKRKYPTLMELANAVFTASDVSLPQLLSRGKSNWLCHWRHIFAWLAKRRCRRSTNEIGTFLNRDHSTIVHSHSLVRGNRGRFAEDILLVEGLLGGTSDGLENRF